VSPVSYGHAGPVTSLCCGPGAPGVGPFVATGSLDGGVRLFDLQVNAAAFLRCL
jgi:WD40 repeat protein